MGYLFTAIIAAIVSLLMWALLRASRRKPATTGAGNRVLRYSAGFTVIGYILISFTAFFGVIFAFNEEEIVRHLHRGHEK